MRLTYFIILSFGTLLLSCAEKSVEDIVFLDNYKLFEEFDMKKDFDVKLERELHGDKERLSELSFDVQKESDPLLKATKEKKFYALKAQFDQRFQSLSSKYTNKVYDELNKLIDVYGKEKGYKIILGSDGEGSVMYVDTTFNITIDMITYVNDAYSKK